MAALLEIARILREAPTQSNSIVFAFTDGEEAGLLGAEAFFSQHPWAQRRGRRDQRRRFRVGGAGAAAAQRPAQRRDTRCVSFGRAISGRVVVLQKNCSNIFPTTPICRYRTTSGKPGIDFVFAGERNHYHTPHDTIANLSLATLQHHGENVLPLVRALADADLSKTDAELRLRNADAIRHGSPTRRRRGSRFRSASWCCSALRHGDAGRDRAISSPHSAS